MISEGLPSDRIQLIGQPYFGWLVARQRHQKTTLQTASEYILFASQPNANELEILRILIQVLAEYKPLKQLLIRFHPRQGKCPDALNLLVESRLPFAIDKSVDLLATLRQQDMVLGITSIILIEAALMGIPSGSLIMGVEDTLMTNRYGVTVPLESPLKLQEFLESNQYKEISQEFMERQQNADLRVAELCTSLI